MKRLLSTNGTEPVMKHIRFLYKNEEDIMSNSSDRLDSDEKFGEQETNNNYELIDLTEDESNSYLSMDIEECPICLETFTDLQSIGIHLIITPCHHVLCRLCIDQVLSRSSRCPLCQRNINSTTLMPYCILA